MALGPKINIFAMLLFVSCYLLGSIPFGLILAKLFGKKDVRAEGSGNIGATNVARVAGPTAGILTLSLDAGKGWAAVWLAARVMHGDAAFMVIAGFLALLGHCFPLWLRFRGGKGVATAAGVFGALCPEAMLAAAILFALVVWFWRYVSLASLTAAAAIPLLIYFLWAPHFAPPNMVTVGSLAIAALVIFQHRGNIGRLLRGEEPKFSLSKKQDEA
ncbi:MAG TPA: glycerol-3-phosphate 1-O-acyltransferase PlsY [Candidatus Acidoferrum sp.]|jgi:glycerol-3-phosphate acyltransferase PlsY